jgi:hypothetical protein
MPYPSLLKTETLMSPLWSTHGITHSETVHLTIADRVLPYMFVYKKPHWGYTLAH